MIGATIREPAVAGTFYPADAETLRADVRALLSPPHPSPCAARLLFVPHAGYRYSGVTAGAGYREVCPPEIAVILAPNHHGIGAPLALPLRGSWRTPLGDLAIDEDASRAVAASCRSFRDDWRAHARDHAVEVHLPFLQVLAEAAFRPPPRLVTISVGTHDERLLVEAGVALAAGLVRAGLEDPSRMLLVVSSDMSHYIPAAAARRLDLPVLEHVRRVEPEAVHREVFTHGVTACGVAPAVLALAAARELGASPGRLVRYGHSGETTGDESSVVAYAAVLVPPAGGERRA